MVKLEKVEKYFNRYKSNQIHAINSTTLKFENTGLVAILGNSGSGKTTLLNVIGGLDKPDKGKIYIGDKKITNIRNSKLDKIRNLNVGYVFQNYYLLNHLTVFENVSLVLRMLGVKKKEEINERVNNVLKMVGMYPYKNRLSSMLSGGQKQRVAIARAIVKNPNIIIADEPTGNLDSKNSIEIMEILKTISKKKLVILVTHEQKLADMYASRIIKIVDGKVVSDENNSNAHENISYENKNYNEESILNKDFNKRNASLYNPINMITSGVKRICNYSILKKILLIGFLISAMSIVYSVSSILGIINVKDEQFVTTNKNYLKLTTTRNNVTDYLKYEKLPFIKYMLPGDSNLDFTMPCPDYYQTTSAKITLHTSVVDSKEITNSDIIMGEMPKKNTEVVLDKMIIDDILEKSITKNLGITNYEELIGREILAGDEYLVDSMESRNQTTLPAFKIVGIVDKKSPSIYLAKDNFINLFSIYKIDEQDYSRPPESTINLVDYKLVEDEIEIVEGSLPVNDYEIIVSNQYKDQFELDETIEQTVNGKELKVVGYYESTTEKDENYSNENTIKYQYIEERNNIAIYPENSEETMKYFSDKDMKIESVYEKDRNEYIAKMKPQIIATIAVSGVILLISLLEIFLLIRSSFLSRKKEVGILRAIGVKKTDIYKMFLGEILSISIFISLPGILIMSFIVNKLAATSFFLDKLVMNSLVIIISIVIVFVFNILIGLLPVHHTLRKRPAQILTENSVD